MRFLGRSLIGLFLTALTVALLAWAGQITFAAVQDRRARDGAPAAARERVLAVNIVAARAGIEIPMLTAFGEVKARRALEVRAPVAGRIVDLADGFEEGGVVEAGQSLLQIDPADAEADLAVARADLAGAEAEVRDAARGLDLAEAELAAAEAQRDLQALALQRQRDLSDRGVGSAAAVETAELSLSAAAQAVLSSRGSVTQAETRIDSADLALDRARIALDQAERDLADRTLVAEFGGRLSDVTVLRGGLVNQNEQVATLIDPTELEVAFRLSAAQHARLLDAEGTLIGAPIRAVLDVLGLDLTATGRITREAPAVGEGQTGRLVFARLEDAAGFRPGDFVRVEVEEPELTAAVRLPATALSAQGDVLVLGEEDRLAAVVVDLLRRQGDEVLVRGPIDGRDVVAERNPALGDGIRVRPLRPDERSASAEAAPEMVTLDPERRARIVSYIQNNGRIPSDVKERMLSRFEEEEVPAAMVARIESRMGG